MIAAISSSQFKTSLRQCVRVSSEAASAIVDLRGVAKPINLHLIYLFGYARFIDISNNGSRIISDIFIQIR
jgi:hypothetical protein